MALQRLDDDERAKFNLGRQGKANLVNEPGPYTLILGSRIAFKKKIWPVIAYESGFYTLIRNKGGSLMKKPSRERLKEILCFLLKTSVPRILNDMENKKNELKNN